MCNHYVVENTPGSSYSALCVFFYFFFFLFLAVNNWLYTPTPNLRRKSSFILKILSSDKIQRGMLCWLFIYLLCILLCRFITLIKMQLRMWSPSRREPLTLNQSLPSPHLYIDVLLEFYCVYFTLQFEILFFYVLFLMYNTLVNLLVVLYN